MPPCAVCLLHARHVRPFLLQLREQPQYNLLGHEAEDAELGDEQEQPLAEQEATTAAAQQVAGGAARGARSAQELPLEEIRKAVSELLEVGIELAQG